MTAAYEILNSRMHSSHKSKREDNEMCFNHYQNHPSPTLDREVSRQNISPNHHETHPHI